ncbi:hypothetical protein B0H14DRAFT_3469889 [Mycena olivaceomarginata]|nr:hypothetical protein B0H14DRAFT_3469889 [Mycena olivaceomarginata]
MSRSSTPSSVLSLFTKRRRAFLACTECRKRKIKCVSVPDTDSYRPCTRCTQKGIKCEYYAVPDNYHPSSQPRTPPHGHAREIEIPPSDNYSDPGCSYLGVNFPGSKAARRSSLPIPASASTARYPYRRRNTVAESRSRPSSRAPTPSATNFAPHQPSPRLSLLSTPLRDFTALQTPTAANPQPELDFADMFTLPQPSSAPSTQQPFTSLPTPIAAYPTPKYDSDDMVNRIHPLIFGGTYDLNNSSLQSDQRHSQVYAPPAEPSGIWPEPILCICPPGPCYCGANFNDGGE